MRPTETDQRRESQPHVDERKTRELCANEDNGMRCMRPKGHTHEHYAYANGGMISW
jgi:hypothetical protein